MTNRWNSILLVVFTLALSVAAQESSSGPALQPADAPKPAWDLSPARKLMQDGNYRDALLVLKEIEARAPGARGLSHDLGVVYYHLANFAEAVPALRRAFAESPDDHEAEQLLGMSFFQIGKPSEAIIWLQQFKAVMPAGNLDIEYVLGLCYLRTRDYDHARSSFASMYGVPSESTAGYLLMARMLLRQGDDQAAEQHAQKAAALDSRVPLVHLLLGEIYLYRSELPRAIDELEQEIKLNPACAAAYDRLADAYLRTSRLNDAEALLKRSLLLDGTSTGAYILLGKVQLKKQDYSQARMYLERAVRMDPNNFISHHLLGEAYQRAGKTLEAEQELKLAQQLQSAGQPRLEDAH
jgi:Flp pilus assembly protein TadD